jgi:hypothetical protein
LSKGTRAPTTTTQPGAGSGGCPGTLAPKPKPRVSKPAHDAALHFLARPKQYPLTAAERADLVQVVEGFTSPHDREAARRGIEWMRERYRRLGQTPRF